MNLSVISAGVAEFRNKAWFQEAGAVRKIAAVLLFVPCLATAGTIGGRAYAFVQGAAYAPHTNQQANCSYNYFSNTTGLSGSCSYIDNGTIDRNASDGQNWNGTQDDFFTSAASSVDSAGNLHASYDISVVNFPVDPGTPCSQFSCSESPGGDVYAYSTDQLTFSTSGPQIPFQIVSSITLDGAMTYSGSPVNPATVTTNFGTYTAGGTYQATISSGQIAPGGIDYTFLYMHISATLYCDSVGSGPYSGIHLCNTSAAADFSNTLKVTGLAVEDMSGNPLSGYSVSSQSGYDYSSLITTNQSAAPEPGTMLLGGAGALLLMVRGRSRARRI